MGHDLELFFFAVGKAHFRSLSVLPTLVVGCVRVTQGNVLRS